MGDESLGLTLSKVFFCYFVVSSVVNKICLTSVNYCFQALIALINSLACSVSPALPQSSLRLSRSFVRSRSIAAFRERACSVSFSLVPLITCVPFCHTDPSLSLSATGASPFRLKQISKLIANNSKLIL